MKTVYFITDEDSGNVNDDHYDFEIHEEDFNSEQDFLDFVEWAVDMVRHLHNTKQALTCIEVREEPVVDSYVV